MLSSVAATNPRWLAPEILSGKGYTFASDVYSFGWVAVLCGCVCWLIGGRLLGPRLFGRRDLPAGWSTNASLPCCTPLRWLYTPIAHLSTAPPPPAPQHLHVGDADLAGALPRVRPLAGGGNGDRELKEARGGWRAACLPG